VKIIATMGTSKYLAEVDGFELRELNSDVKIEVGAEFEIRKAAETLAALRGLSKNKLIYVKKQIDDLQKKFQEIEDNYEAVMLLDTIKNSEES
jgi:uncharacterized membrane protein